MCILKLESCWTLITWESITGFLNSSFTSSLSGALVGALAGALMAQRIADRAKQREALLQEIRSTNAAIMVAFTISNAALAFKKQFTKDVYETYKTKKTELQEFLMLRAQGQQLANLPFEFQADFRTLQMPLVPIDVLRTQLYEKISASGRPLAAVAALAGSIASLIDVIHKRNILIERFRQLGDAEQVHLPAFYFGMPYGEGHVNTEFSDAIEALYSQNDDVIFFSELLSIDLMAHGNRILGDYKKLAKVKEERIHRVDFTDAHNRGLMPDAENYADWRKGFPNAVPLGDPGP